MKYADEVITIVCDDIRREIGNKRSIMGVYDDIVVESVPIMMSKICLSVSFRKIKKTFKSVKSIIVSLKNPNGDKIELPEMVPPGNILIGGTYNMDIFVVPFKVEKTGTYTWALRFNGEEKPTIVHKTDVRIKT